MVKRQMKDHGAAAAFLDADWTVVLYAPTADDAGHYRVLLEGEGFAVKVGDESMRRRGAGIPVMVPAEAAAPASELLACLDASGADWDDDDDGDDDDDDLLDDDEEDEDDDEEDEDDEFLPDDDDDLDDDEEFGDLED